MAINDDGNVGKKCSEFSAIRLAQRARKASVGKPSLQKKAEQLKKIRFIITYKYCRSSILFLIYSFALFYVADKEWRSYYYCYYLVECSYELYFAFLGYKQI